MGSPEKWDQWGQYSPLDFVQKNWIQKHSEIIKISARRFPLYFQFFSERFWSKPSHYNVSIGACAIAFAAEMTLFLISAHFAIRAKADAHVRLENEEVDALLQGMSIWQISCNTWVSDTLSVNSMNRSFRDQVEQQTRILNDSQRASRNSLTQSQRDDDLPL